MKCARVGKGKSEYLLRKVAAAVGGPLLEVLRIHKHSAAVMRTACWLLHIANDDGG